MQNLPHVVYRSLVWSCASHQTNSVAQMAVCGGTGPMSIPLWVSRPGLQEFNLGLLCGVLNRFAELS
eukprot:2865083-Prorocentrum_lima.AAC.1